MNSRSPSRMPAGVCCSASSDRQRTMCDGSGHRIRDASCGAGPRSRRRGRSRASEQPPRPASTASRRAPAHSRRRPGGLARSRSSVHPGRRPTGTCGDRRKVHRAPVPAMTSSCVRACRAQAAGDSMVTCPTAFDDPTSSHDAFEPMHTLLDVARCVFGRQIPEASGNQYLYRPSPALERHVQSR